jgi:hypothetical protein
MKKVFTAPSVVPCDLLKSFLAADGIPSFIRNEYGTSLLGYGLPVSGGSALPWSWPELWIPVQDLERATPIIEAFQKTQQSHSAGEQS